MKHVSSGSGLKFGGNCLEWIRNWGCRIAIASLFFEYFKLFLLSIFTTVLTLFNIRNELDLMTPVRFVYFQVFIIFVDLFLNRILQSPTKREDFKNSQRLFKEFLKETLKMMCLFPFVFQVCFDIFFLGRPHRHPILMFPCVVLWGGSIRQEQNLSNWLVSYFCRGIPVFACGYWQSEVAAGLVFMFVCVNC